MSTSIINEVAYGLSTALINVPLLPIVSNRAPGTGDKAQLGTIWVDKPANAAYILTSVVANSATWISLVGGSGSFTTITASGNITSTAGNISATAGSLSAGTTVTAGTGLTVTTGNATISTGNIVLTAGDLTAAAGTASAESIVATGDAGATSSATTMTNVTNTSLSTGTLSVKSTTANPGNNTGFLKFYVNTTPVFVPYFSNIAP